MYLDNRSNPLDFQGHRSKVKVTGPHFRILYHCEVGQKKFVSTITHELLYIQVDDILHKHVPWQLHEPYWIWRSYVKSQGHLGFWCFSVCMMLRLPADST